MADVNALLHAIKGQRATVGNPAAQAAAGNMVTSMQNQPPAVAPNDQNLISAIAKIKHANGIPLEPHESQAIGVPHQPEIVGAQVLPFSPSHIKNAIEFGMHQGHPPEHILAHIHMMLGGHSK